VFIAPNLVDDMHGISFNPFGAQANMKAGDTWLAANLPAITGSAAYQRGGLVLVVWDEDDLSGGLSGSDDPVPLFVLSPLAKSGGFSSSAHADHYALLATIEDGLGLPRLGHAAQATPITDFFVAR
jgi:phosphatidylinositol-3-phosphatase